MPGRRFGRLLVIEEDRGWREPKILVRCDCGVEKRVGKNHLRNGATRSCGCYMREVSVRANTTHGMSDTAEHNIWLSMLQRCTNPRNNSYRHYGARGIGVCGRWTGQDGFRNFYEDMGPRPPGTSMDRVDPNGDYGPANCRWADKQTQSDNKRNSIPRIEQQTADAISRVSTSDKPSYTKAEVLSLLRVLRFNLVGE